MKCGKNNNITAKVKSRPFDTSEREKVEIKILQGSVGGLQISYRVHVPEIMKVQSEFLTWLK